MGMTPSKSVSSGFYRVHLWVLMGLNTLASLCVYTQRESLHSQFDNVNWVLGLAIGLAIVSYLGAVLWLYEQKAAGTVTLFLIMLGGMLAAAFATPWHEVTAITGVVLEFLDLGSSGLLLGTT